MTPEEFVQRACQLWHELKGRPNLHLDIDGVHVVCCGGDNRYSFGHYRSVTLNFSVAVFFHADDIETFQQYAIKYYEHFLIGAVCGNGYNIRDEEGLDASIKGISPTDQEVEGEPEEALYPPGSGS